MIYLADTNILLRFLHSTDNRHPIVRAAVEKLRASGHQLKTTPQNFTEFWRTSTRPIDKDGFGLTPLATDQLLQIIEQHFPLLPDSPDVYSEWRHLVVTYGVSGAKVHDARLVAAMICKRVTHILTFNFKDFS
ncbi:MAG: type II toxin-antitoxin system VapC family toxin, partial [Candidatus Poribacteria bacterium]|nr:type II toxin-antitoxin system VapC family toxin [Candidatus Poribacteria bacterium]